MLVTTACAVAFLATSHAAAQEPPPAAAGPAEPLEAAWTPAAAAPFTPHVVAPTEATIHLAPLEPATRAALTGGAVVTMWRNLVGSTLRSDREAIWYPSHASPSVAVWGPVASLGDDGPVLVAGSRYRSIGPENAGSAVEGSVLVQQRAGALALGLQAVVGRGLGERTDVDAEGVASALVELVPALHVGAEARARTEIEDELETDEDVGRPAEIVAAGVTAWSPAPGLELSTLAGWRSPRGSAEPGALVLGAISRSF